jgi:hypothetical protein
VASNAEAKLREAMQELVPEFVKDSPIWLPSDTTMVSAGGRMAVASRSYMFMHVNREDSVTWCSGSEDSSAFINMNGSNVKWVKYRYVLV